MWARLTGAVLIVAICAGVVAIFVFRSPAGSRVTLSGNDLKTLSSRAPSSSRATSSLPTSPPTTPATLTEPAEQVAAQHLAGLLTQSASDRGAIVNAVSDVNACGSSLSTDLQTFQQAAASRQQLHSRLSSLPDESALPAQLVTDLTNAWQSSAEADQDLAAWAKDENSHRCRLNDSSDANLQAATAPDDQATTYKKAFASLWDPIATQYGLTAYQWNGL